MSSSSSSSGSWIDSDSSDDRDNRRRPTYTDAAFEMVRLKSHVPQASISVANDATPTHHPTSSFQLSTSSPEFEVATRFPKSAHIERDKEQLQSRNENEVKTTDIAVQEVTLQTICTTSITLFRYLTSRTKFVTAVRALLSQYLPASNARLYEIQRSECGDALVSNGLSIPLDLGREIGIAGHAALAVRHLDAEQWKELQKHDRNLSDDHSSSNQSDNLSSKSPTSWLETHQSHLLPTTSSNLYLLFSLHAMYQPDAHFNSSIDLTIKKQQLLGHAVQLLILIICDPHTRQPVGVIEALVQESETIHVSFLDAFTSLLATALVSRRDILRSNDCKSIEIDVNDQEVIKSTSRSPVWTSQSDGSHDAPVVSVYGDNSIHLENDLPLLQAMNHSIKAIWQQKCTWQVSAENFETILTGIQVVLQELATLFQSSPPVHLGMPREVLRDVWTRVMNGWNAQVRILFADENLNEFTAAYKLEKSIDHYHILDNVRHEASSELLDDMMTISVLSHNEMIASVLIILDSTRGSKNGEIETTLVPWVVLTLQQYTAWEQSIRSSIAFRDELAHGMESMANAYAKEEELKQVLKLSMTLSTCNSLEDIMMLVNHYEWTDFIIHKLTLVVRDSTDSDNAFWTVDQEGSKCRFNGGIVSMVLDMGLPLAYSSHHPAFDSTWQYLHPPSTTAFFYMVPLVVESTNMVLGALEFGFETEAEQLCLMEDRAVLQQSIISVISPALQRQTNWITEKNDWTIQYETVQQAEQQMWDAWSQFLIMCSEIDMNFEWAAHIHHIQVLIPSATIVHVWCHESDEWIGRAVEEQVRTNGISATLNDYHNCLLPTIATFPLTTTEGITRGLLVLATQVAQPFTCRELLQGRMVAMVISQQLESRIKDHEARQQLARHQQDLEIHQRKWEAIMDKHDLLIRKVSWNQIVYQVATCTYPTTGKTSDQIDILFRIITSAFGEDAAQPDLIPFILTPTCDLRDNKMLFRALNTNQDHVILWDHAPVYLPQVWTVAGPFFVGVCSTIVQQVARQATEGSILLTSFRLTDDNDSCGWFGLFTTLDAHECTTFLVQLATVFQNHLLMAVRLEMHQDVETKLLLESQETENLRTRLASCQQVQNLYNEGRVELYKWLNQIPQVGTLKDWEDCRRKMEHVLALYAKNIVLAWRENPEVEINSLEVVVVFQDEKGNEHDTSDAFSLTWETRVGSLYQWGQLSISRSGAINEPRILHELLPVSRLVTSILLGSRFQYEQTQVLNHQDQLLHCHHTQLNKLITRMKQHQILMSVLFQLIKLRPDPVSDPTLLFQLFEPISGRFRLWLGYDCNLWTVYQGIKQVLEGDASKRLLSLPHIQIELDKKSIWKVVIECVDQDSTGSDCMVLLEVGLTAWWQSVELLNKSNELQRLLDLEKQLGVERIEQDQQEQIRLQKLVQEIKQLGQSMAQATSRMSLPASLYAMEQQLASISDAQLMILECNAQGEVVDIILSSSFPLPSFSGYQLQSLLPTEQSSVLIHRRDLSPLEVASLSTVLSMPPSATSLTLLSTQLSNFVFILIYSPTETIPWIFEHTLYILTLSYGMYQLQTTQVKQSEDAESRLSTLQSQIEQLTQWRIYEKDMDRHMDNVWKALLECSGEETFPTLLKAAICDIIGCDDAWLWTKQEGESLILLWPQIPGHPGIDESSLIQQSRLEPLQVVDKKGQSWQRQQIVIYKTNSQVLGVLALDWVVSSEQAYSVDKAIILKLEEWLCRVLTLRQNQLMEAAHSCSMRNQLDLLSSQLTRQENEFQALQKILKTYEKEIANRQQEKKIATDGLDVIRAYTTTISTLDTNEVVWETLVHVVATLDGIHGAQWYEVPADINYKWKPKCTTLPGKDNNQIAKNQGIHDCLDTCRHTDRIQSVEMMQPAQSAYMVRTGPLLKGILVWFSLERTTHEIQSKIVELLLAMSYQRTEEIDRLSVTTTSAMTLERTTHELEAQFRSLQTNSALNAQRYEKWRKLHEGLVLPDSLWVPPNEVKTSQLIAQWLKLKHEWVETRLMHVWPTVKIRSVVLYGLAGGSIDQGFVFSVSQDRSRCGFECRTIHQLLNRKNWKRLVDCLCGFPQEKENEVDAAWYVPIVIRSTEGEGEQESRVVGAVVVKVDKIEDEEEGVVAQQQLISFVDAMASQIDWIGQTLYEKQQAKSRIEVASNQVMTLNQNSSPLEAVEPTDERQEAEIPCAWDQMQCVNDFLFRLMIATGNEPHADAIQSIVKRKLKRLSPGRLKNCSLQYLIHGHLHATLLPKKESSDRLTSPLYTWLHSNPQPHDGLHSIDPSSYWVLIIPTTSPTLSIVIAMQGSDLEGLRQQQRVFERLGRAVASSIHVYWNKLQAAALAEDASRKVKEHTQDQLTAKELTVALVQTNAAHDRALYDLLIGLLTEKVLEERMLVSVMIKHVQQWLGGERVVFYPTGQAEEDEEEVSTCMRVHKDLRVRIQSHEGKVWGTLRASLPSSPALTQQQREQWKRFIHVMGLMWTQFRDQQNRATANKTQATTLKMVEDLQSQVSDTTTRLIAVERENKELESVLHQQKGLLAANQQLNDQVDKLTQDLESVHTQYNTSQMALASATRQLVDVNHQLEQSIRSETHLIQMQEAYRELEAHQQRLEHKHLKQKLELKQLRAELKNRRLCEERDQAELIELRRQVAVLTEKQHHTGSMDASSVANAVAQATIASTQAQVQAQAQAQAQIQAQIQAQSRGHAQLHEAQLQAQAQARADAKAHTTRVHAKAVVQRRFFRQMQLQQERLKQKQVDLAQELRHLAEMEVYEMQAQPIKTARQSAVLPIT